MVRTAHPTNINGPEDRDVSNKSGSPRDLQVVLQVYIMTKFLSPLLGAAILVVAQAAFTTVHAEETPDMTVTVSLESASQIYTLNRIAAVVNGEVILVSELNTSVRKVEEPEVEEQVVEETYQEERREQEKSRKEDRRRRFPFLRRF